MDISEKSLIIECSKNLEFLRSSIDLSDGVIKLCEKEGFNFSLEKLNQLMYFNSLITIAKLDIAISSKFLKKSSEKWEIIHFIKNSYLTIYESLEKLKTHKKLLHELTSVKDANKEFYKNLDIETKEFMKKYEFDTKINLIRNKTVGHIDKDFKLYYDELNKLKKSETIDMIDAFIKLNLKYLELCSDLINPN
mgnify:CR=1 FL=1